MLNLDDEIKSEIKSIAPEYKRIQFYIDFDKKTFINGFIDIEVEETICRFKLEWKFGVSSEYVPIEIKGI